jgi:hypothetical protein
MSKFRVDLDKVEVIEGQGVGEGDLELQVTAMEGKHTVIFPSPSTWVQVDKNGAPKTINRTLATYEVTTGTLSKRVTVNVKEVDGGTLGGDDEGQGYITFDLTPSTGISTKDVTLSLARDKMKPLGKVKVTMTAQPA